MAVKVKRRRGCAALLAGLWVLGSPAVALTAEPIASPRLRSLAEALERKDAGASENFWREVQQVGTPLMERTSPPGQVHESESDVVLFTFLTHCEAQDGVWYARGDSTSNAEVRFHEFDPNADGDRRMQRLPGSDVCFKSYRLPARSQFFYNLMWPQGREPRADATWRLMREGQTYELFADPLNPRQLPVLPGTDDFSSQSTHGSLSFVHGPDAIANPWLDERSGSPHGHTESFRIRSASLGDERTIWIHLPAEYRNGRREYPFALFYDGASYMKLTGARTTLDNLHADGLIAPTVGIFVDSIDNAARDQLTPDQPAFQHFIAMELMPELRARYRLSHHPRHAVAVGASYGGLCAAATAFNHPEIFGNVLSQSGSYWWPNGYEPDAVGLSAAGWAAREYARAARKPVRFYLDVGIWEGDLRFYTQQFRDVLIRKGYEVAYHEGFGGHDIIRWRANLAIGLMSLVGTAKARELASEMLRKERDTLQTDNEGMSTPAR